jgi:hypothetical protein
MSHLPSRMVCCTASPGALLRVEKAPPNPSVQGTRRSAWFSFAGVVPARP